MTQKEEKEGDLSNLRLGQKEIHSPRKRDVVEEGSKGSQISFAFSFGLLLSLPLPFWNNDQFQGLLFFLESPMT